MDKRQVYMGAECIVSPLGKTAEDNFAALIEGRSGIQCHQGAGFRSEDVFLAKMPEQVSENRFYHFLESCLQGVNAQLRMQVAQHPRTLLIISTTKGEIEAFVPEGLHAPATQLAQAHGFLQHPIVISNACISGVLAINTAARYLQAGLYDHAVVLGADVLSDFVLFGFQSLFAISDSACQPFDKDRKGINLGEGAAGMVLSTDPNIFVQEALRFAAGSSANDANHISGPSRTGEGLFRTASKSLAAAGLSAEDIDHVSLHGTATNYNDEMESIAMQRLGLLGAPSNSLKAYYGHTLGAAGLIESAICMQSLRKGQLVPSRGFTTQGTSHKLNLITENTSAPLRHVLKTASGFGGCNASVIISRQA